MKKEKKNPFTMCVLCSARGLCSSPDKAVIAADVFTRLSFSWARYFVTEKETDYTTRAKQCVIVRQMSQDEERGFLPLKEKMKKK